MRSLGPGATIPYLVGYPWSRGHGLEIRHAKAYLTYAAGQASSVPTWPMRPNELKLSVSNVRPCLSLRTMSQTLIDGVWRFTDIRCHDRHGMEGVEWRPIGKPQPRKMSVMCVSGLGIVDEADPPSGSRRPVRTPGRTPRVPVAAATRAVCSRSHRNRRRTWELRRRVKLRRYLAADRHALQKTTQ